MNSRLKKKGNCGRLQRSEETGRLLRDAYREADRRSAPVLAAAEQLWDRLKAQDEPVSARRVNSPGSRN